MAQADPKSTEREALLKRHFALGEEQQYKLHKLTRVLAGLQAMAHDGTMTTARDPIEIAREDMAAIFEMIGEEVERATTDMPFVSTH